MIQLTNYQYKNTIMDTQYGHITYKGWLELESKRIGGKTEIRTAASGVALFVDDEGLKLTGYM